MKCTPILWAAAALCLAAPAQAQLPPSCIFAPPEPCLYQPAATYAVGQADFVLQDPARGNHPVPLRVYYPMGAAGARPVVIWHHGGGSEDPAAPGSNQASSRERGQSHAEAGYVSIHIIRRVIGNPGPAELEICVKAGLIPNAGAVGGPLAACKDFLGSQVNGPKNALFLRSILPAYTVGLLPGFPGTLDLTKIVIGGWSGGSGLVFSHAGVTRQWGGHSEAPTPIAGVVAFTADAPQGPGYAGFQGGGFGEDAYYAIDARPYMFFSGRGDETGEPAESRVTGWIASTPGNKFLSWVNSKDAIHATMDIGASGCAGGVLPDVCRWHRAAGQAFLDAAVLGRPAAVDWLKSDAYRTLTGGLIELHRR